MRELDRYIRRAGGVLVNSGRHRVYLLDGERISVHCGSHIGRTAERAVKAKVRQIVKRRGE